MSSLASRSPFCVNTLLRSLTNGYFRLMFGGCALLLLHAGSAWGQTEDLESDEKTSETCAAAVSEEESKAAEALLREKVPDLLVDVDSHRGGTRSLMNATGFLTQERRGADPRKVADTFLAQHRALLGLTEEDLRSRELTDAFRSKVTGITHHYFGQVENGLAVHNGQLQVHVDRAGRVLSVNSTFVPSVAKQIQVRSPELSAAEAVRRGAVAMMKVAAAEPPKILEKPAGKDQRTRLDPEGFSEESIEAHLVWFPPRDRCEVRLAWSFTLATSDGPHVYDLLVDAAGGEVLWSQDRILRDAYQVFSQPVESPSHGGRVLMQDPADPEASPFGWHDTDGAAGAESTTLVGNNVATFTDASNGLPSCREDLVCSFPLTPGLRPDGNADAAATNAFYWVNLMHDVAARYGFTEEAGNFQQLNYSGQGLSGDPVQLEVSPNSPSVNNAYFRSAPDGSPGLMQMFLFNCPTCNPPFRDSALDNGILVHEYAHGISNRLVGGAGNVSCLSRDQHAGEGISDFFALALTHDERSDGDDGRGLGTFVLGEPTTGPGFRIEPYSTDPLVNTSNYETIRRRFPPHAVGEVWAQAAWRTYWALIDRYGFDPNLSDVQAMAGNHRMLLYAVTGLALAPCDPTFADLRDGILQAAMAITGRQDICLLRNVFADYGLGSDADPAGPNDLRVKNGFNPGSDCGCTDSPADLVGWWGFDEPEMDLAYDLSDLGNGSPAVPRGNPRAGRGLVDHGAVLDGASRFETSEDSNFHNIDFDETGFTIEGWFMPQTLPSDSRTQIQVWHFGRLDSLNRTVMLTLETRGVLRVSYFDGRFQTTFTTPAGLIEPGRWNHVAVTYEGPVTDLSQIWVDGQEVASLVHEVRLNQGRVILQMGGDPTLAFPLWDGRLDEVGLYRRGLSAGEIQDIASAYNAGRCKLYCGRPMGFYDRVVQMRSTTGSVTGTGGPDLVLGSPGPDTIQGRAGRDCLFGFSGEDDLSGNRDQDMIYGGSGNDTIQGNEAGDELFGGTGDDTIWGRRGDDVIDGGADEDVIEGNEGDDEIYGSGGDDVIRGRRGDDEIFGGDGNDTLDGDDGDDVIHGGDGSDTVHGGNGSDTIYGDRGRDRLHGGTHADEIEGGRGRDFLQGGDGQDELRGQDGNDRLCGGRGGDTLDGGPGTDEFRGGSGNDTEIEVENEVDGDQCNTDAFEAW